MCLIILHAPVLGGLPEEYRQAALGCVPMLQGAGAPSKGLLYEDCFMRGIYYIYEESTSMPCRKLGALERFTYCIYDMRFAF